MARAIAATEVFAHFCRGAGLTDREVDAVATSAIREATQLGGVPGARAPRRGLEVRVLSREEEARAGYLAAVNSTTLRDGAVLDLGGGSMQLVERRGPRRGGARVLAARRRAHDRALPLRRRAAERESRSRALREHVARKLERAPWLGSRERRLVGVGGTVRNLAAAAQRALELPAFGVQGFVIERARARRARSSGSPRCRRPSAGACRASSPRAATSCSPARSSSSRCSRPAASTAIEATEAGLREGVFFERALAGRPEPLFDDVRRASVAQPRRAVRHDARPHAPRRAALALGLFDELAAAGPAPRRPGRARAARGGRRCCTTSASPSTTTTTTSTRATSSSTPACPASRRARSR